MRHFYPVLFVGTGMWWMDGWMARMRMSMIITYLLLNLYPCGIPVIITKDKDTQKEEFIIIYELTS